MLNNYQISQYVVVFSSIIYMLTIFGLIYVLYKKRHHTYVASRGFENLVIFLTSALFICFSILIGLDFKITNLLSEKMCIYFDKREIVFVFNTIQYTILTIKLLDFVWCIYLDLKSKLIVKLQFLFVIVNVVSVSLLLLYNIITKAKKFNGVCVYGDISKYLIIGFDLYLITTSSLSFFISNNSFDSDLFADLNDIYKNILLIMNTNILFADVIWFFDYQDIFNVKIVSILIISSLQLLSVIYFVPKFTIAEIYSTNDKFENENLNLKLWLILTGDQHIGIFEKNEDVLIDFINYCYISDCKIKILTDKNHLWVSSKRLVKCYEDIIMYKRLYREKLPRDVLIFFSEFIEKYVTSGKLLIPEYILRKLDKKFDKTIKNIQSFSILEKPNFDAFDKLETYIIAILKDYHGQFYFLKDIFNRPIWDEIVSNVFPWRKKRKNATNQEFEQKKMMINGFYKFNDNTNIDTFELSQLN